MAEFKLINELLLEVSNENETLYAKRGSMIACHGDIHYRRSFLTGNGIQEFLARDITNEEHDVMACEGTGTSLYGFNRQYVKIIPLNGDTLYVESDQLLAFESSIHARPYFLGNRGPVQGVLRGAATGQGLFTTSLRGKGSVAIISKGPCVCFDVSQERRVNVDPDAYIGHSGSLDCEFVVDVNWKTFVGQSSGESYQLRFSGQGKVYVQASERK